MKNRTNYNPESGNVVFFILLAIVLVGLVTAALRSGGQEGAHIDNEQAAINASRLKQYAGEFERGVTFILGSGISEADIMFSNPDGTTSYGNIDDVPAQQLFHHDGGGAEYYKPNRDINDGSAWEFYGNTALPGVGTANPELIVVLPNITANVCAKINEMNGYDAQPDDPGSAQTDCIHGGATLRFTSTTKYTASGSANVPTSSTFSVQPAMEGCVKCEAGGLHFYHVLHAR